jgi:hypothetical protein
MILLAVALAIVTALLIVASYLLGFRLGGEHWRDEVSRVRAQAAQAERRIHDLSRQAFIAMAEEAERRRR